jgi:anthranilate synthase component 2
MIILIDNYDSFTFNLVQYLGDLGADVEVHRNDQITVDAVLAKKPQGVVISPGPSDPDHAGICLDTIKACAAAKMPLLGVCLGHQAIGQAFGGKVIRAPHPVHGKTSMITHGGASVFAGLPSPIEVTRYHSLAVERETLPKDLHVTAQSDDGVIMGLHHATLPIHGVQFHPESIMTKHGHSMLKNFLDML